ncbi:MAG: YoaK family protein [Ruthenibacterium lactatiformans]
MLRVGLCLAFTGGFLDAYTYLLREEFANAQTGNMVLMALYAARRDRGLYYLLPIAAFLQGDRPEWLKARLTNAQHIAWQHVVLLAEAILVFAVDCAAERAGRCGECDGFVHLLSQVNSFGARGACLMPQRCARAICAVQASMCSPGHTATKRRAVALRYCAVILVFCAGAWAGAVLAGAWGVHAVWACSAALLAAFGLMLAGR